MKVFKGRPVVSGTCEGPALVSRKGFNTLANLKTAGTVLNKKGICKDQNNEDVYGKTIQGKALCLPETIGSTTGGMVLFCVATMGYAPCCMLFSNQADTLAVSGGVLARYWSDKPFIMVDNLGDEFLDYVKDDMQIKVYEDGTVEVY